MKTTISIFTFPTPIHIATIELETDDTHSMLVAVTTEQHPNLEVGTVLDVFLGENRDAAAYIGRTYYVGQEILNYERAMLLVQARLNDANRLATWVERNPEIAGKRSEEGIRNQKAWRKAVAAHRKAEQSLEILRKVS